MSSSSPTPSPTPAPELNQLGNIRYFGWVCGGLVGFAIAYCGFWVYCHRQMRVIKVHQPLFLITICVGLFVWSMAIVPGSMDDEILSEQGCDRACMATQWLTAMGYTTAFAALFAKMFRINKLFRTASRFQRVKVEAKDVLRPFLVLFTINFLLLLAWTLVDPLRWKREPINENEPWNTFGYCSSGAAGDAFHAFIALVNFISLILVCIQAWKARDIGVEFNQSKYLAVGIYNWVQLQLIVVPTEIALGDDKPDATYLLQASVLLMECFSMLLVLFVPIFMQVRKYRRLQEQRQSNAVGSTMGGNVHITGIRTSTTPRDTVISAMTNSTGNGEGQHTDNTQVIALKNRISALEDDINDLDEIKQRNVDLEKRCKELEELLREDEENGKICSELFVEGQHTGNTQVTALKNRISTLEDDMNDELEEQLQEDEKDDKTSSELFVREETVKTDDCSSFSK